MSVTSPHQSPIRRVVDVVAPEVPALVQPEWLEQFPWLVQGTTMRGSGEAPFDLGLFSGGSPEDAVRQHWHGFVERTGCLGAYHARQVHGSDVSVHRSDGAGSRIAAAVADPPHPILLGPCDGHVTDELGVLATVTVADCVPVFLVDPKTRSVGAIHAGWRGTAAGVLESGLRALLEAFEGDASDVHMHMGPSICSDCYEVGPEVFEALGQEPPASPTPIDLRSILAERAIAAGVVIEHITVSTHCTRCTGSDLFSHRGGDAHRQIGYVAVRTSPPGRAAGVVR